MDWTPEQIDDLTRLWNEGRPGSQIARVMGLTANQVIGKAHRLHLSGRASPIKRGGVRVGAAPKPRAAKQKSLKRVKLAGAVPKRDPGLEGRKAYYASLSLNGSQCQFIEGDPKKPESRTCTERAVNGRSWCPHHCAVVFERRPAKPKESEQ